MFSLQGVTKRYGSIVVVQPLDLTIPAGQTTVLLGPSGSGKSTLLRLLMGLLRPDTGTVAFQGQLITSDNAHMVRRQLGYMVQDGGLFPHLTAQDNVTLAAQYLRWPRAVIAERLAELAALVRLPINWLTRYPVQLSGGQRQRVSLMRALMLDPVALLLDEPLGALDPIIRSELQTDLRQVVRQLNKTVVLVTHDLSEAGFLGDTLILLREGRCLQTGTLRDLVEHPKDPFVTRFINAQRSPLDALHEERT